MANVQPIFNVTYNQRVTYDTSSLAPNQYVYQTDDGPPGALRGYWYWDGTVWSNAAAQGSGSLIISAATILLNALQANGGVVMQTNGGPGILQSVPTIPSTRANFIIENLANIATARGSELRLSVLEGGVTQPLFGLMADSSVYPTTDQHFFIYDWFAGALRFNISERGNIGIGAINGLEPSGGGSPMLYFAQTTGNPTGMGSNVAGLFAKDVAGTCEMFAIDEAGNVTQISPHANLDEAVKAGIVLDEDDPYPHVNHEENCYLGLEAFTYTSPMTGKYQRVTRQLPEERIRNWDEDQKDLETRRGKEIAEYERQAAGHEEALQAWMSLPDAQRKESDKPRLDLARPEPFNAKEPPAWIANRLAKVSPSETPDKEASLPAGSDPGIL